MPTKVIEFPSPQHGGSSAITCKVYPLGDDDQSNTDEEAVENLVREGTYTLTFDDIIVDGWHTLHIFWGVAMIGRFDVYLQEQDGLFIAEDAPRAAYDTRGVKLQPNAVNDITIAASAITAGKIATNALTATKFAAGAITNAAIANGAISETKIATGAITAVKFSADALLAIADAVLRRDVSNVEANMGQHSLGTLIQLGLEAEVIDDTILRIYRTDGTTLLLEKTIRTDPNASPITAIQ